MAGLSRRDALAVGLWTGPVVVLANAAPAVAASAAGSPQLQFKNFTAWLENNGSSDNYYYSANLGVQRSDVYGVTSGTVIGLIQVTVEIPKIFLPTPGSNAPSPNITSGGGTGGWSLSSTVATATAYRYTFTYGTTVPAWGGTSQLAFRFGPVHYTSDASGDTSATASATSALPATAGPIRLSVDV